MSKDIITTIISFLLGYIKYFFLTGSVIFSLGVLLFVLINLMPDFSFEFLQYFSFLNFDYRTDTFSMGISEIMEIFTLVSFIIMFVSSVFNLMLKKIFNITHKFSLKLKIILLTSMITLVYVIAIMLITLSNTLDNLFYYIFAIFYVVNLTSLMLYFLVDTLLKKIINFIEIQNNVPKNYIA